MKMNDAERSAILFPYQLQNKCFVIHALLCQCFHIVKYVFHVNVTFDVISETPINCTRIAKMKNGAVYLFREKM